MKPSDENLTAKQEAALVALLSHGTIEAAYKAVGVAKSTMWRWMQMPQFQARYKAERRQFVEAGIATLQKHATTAACVLVQIAADTKAPASARVTAACVAHFAHLLVKVLRIFRVAVSPAPARHVAQAVVALAAGEEPRARA